MWGANKFYVKGGSAAKSGGTLIRLALYELRQVGSPGVGIRRVAESANTTTLFASAEAPYPVAFNSAGGLPATYNVLGGVIYAVGSSQSARRPQRGYEERSA